VSVSSAATRIDVHEGRVAARRPDGELVELVSRQTATLGDDEVVVRPLPPVLFVEGHLSGRHPTDLLDAALVRRLEGLGFLVEAVDEVALRPAQVAGKALIVISPSTSEALGQKIEEFELATVGVPILCSRPPLYGRLSMTSADQPGRFISNATRLQITVPTHPLAAGFSGPVQVTRAPGNLGSGLPGPAAVRIATFPDPGKSDRAVIFAYEQGGPMIGSVARAPARRVGFFMHPDLAPYITDAGWALFDAAARWATSDPHR
jgi:hypothetical protein